MSTNLIIHIAMSIVFFVLNEFTRKKSIFIKMPQAIAWIWILTNVITNSCYANSNEIYYSQKKESFLELMMRVHPKKKSTIIRETEEKIEQHRQQAIELIEISQKMAGDHLDKATNTSYKVLGATAINCLKNGTAINIVFVSLVEGIIKETYFLIGNYFKFQSICTQIKYNVELYDFYTKQLKLLK